MHDVFLFGVLGLGGGAVYAILGLGLVLEYRGSGVVNFGHGAIALFATYEFVDLTDGGMDKGLAFAVTLALSAIGGVLIYTLVIRPLRQAPQLAKLVVTLGLLLALQSAATLVYGSETRAVPAILPTDSVTILDVSFGRDRLWLLGIMVGLAIVLWAIYRFSRFGLATQASAESEKGAVLLGYSPDAIGAANWAIACALAATAGILIAPITSLTGHDLHAPDDPRARGGPDRPVLVVRAHRADRRPHRDRTVRDHALPDRVPVVAAPAGAQGQPSVRDHHRRDGRDREAHPAARCADARAAAARDGGPVPAPPSRSSAPRW